MAEIALLTPASRWARRYRHVNWALADQAMVSGANVLTGILLARFLGVDGFGAYSLAWAILLLVASIHMPLIVGSMMSIGPKQSAADAPGYYGAVIVQNLVVSVVAALIVFSATEASGWLVPAWDAGRLSWPLGVATFTTVWQEFFRRYFFTRGWPALAFLVDTLRYLSQIAIVWAAFLVVPDVVDPGFALWVVAGTAALPAVLGIMSLGDVDYRAGVARAVAVRHYHASKWMVLSYPVEWASEYVFMFAAGTFLGTAAVGALRASQNVAAMTNILFLSLLNIVPTSAASHLHKGGMAAMSRYLRKVTLAGGSLTVVACLVFAAAPAFWLRLLFGEEFAGYGDLVRWWALYYAISFFSLPLRAGLRALEKTRPVFTSRLSGAAVAAVAACLLVPWLGLTGAVMGALASKTVSTLRLAQLYRKHLNEPLD